MERSWTWKLREINFKTQWCHFFCAYLYFNLQHYCFAYNKNLKLNTKHYSFTEQMLISQSRNKNLLNAKDCICLLFFCLMNIEDTLIDHEVFYISPNKWWMLCKRMCKVPFQFSLLTLKIPVELKITYFHFLLQKVHFQLCEL